jgi:arsenate reductase
MYKTLVSQIREIIENHPVSEGRRRVLQPLVDYVQYRMSQKKPVRLHCICTHNSRRSHLTQIWAQTAAAFFNIPDVCCYSGGTEETALFPVIAETLSGQGFFIGKISEGSNPVYGIKYAENEPPIVGFSKKYDHFFNPALDFAAIMTCSQADADCPIIPGAEKRISLSYEDPKISDGTSDQKAVYLERSRQIAAEMMYVFSKI